MSICGDAFEEGKWVLVRMTVLIRKRESEI